MQYLASGSFWPPLSELSQQSAAPPLNKLWGRLCAHLCKQCHCIRSVTQQAFKHRLLWLYLPANACAACRPILRGSQPLLSEAVLPVWPTEDALSARANSFSSDNSPRYCFAADFCCCWFYTRRRRNLRVAKSALFLQALTQQQPCLLVCGKLKTRKVSIVVLHCLGSFLLLHMATASLRL